MKNKLPAWLVLTVICVVAAALLAATNLMTKDVIADNANRAKYETLGRLLPDASGFEEVEGGVVIGKDGAGNPVGYSLAALTQGFGGEVETTVAALPDGTISGISVGGSNFAETAGLGARAKEPEFQAQFAGKTAPVALTKDGGEIEALSGATITSRAVIKGVNQAMEGIAAKAGFTVESTLNAEHVGEGKYAASAPGFGGPVKVVLTLDESRTITEIGIGDSDFAETPGLGARALEPEFQNQFIGKTIPVAIGDIDALSGATITTNAVLEAIGMINDGLDQGLADAPIVEITEAAADTTEEVPAGTTEEAPAAETAPAAEGSYTASAQGFGGPVAVTLTLDENQAISTIEIGDANFAETPGLGAKAQEDEFRNQFIGKKIPVSMEEIDAIAGATITTTAVVTAINEIAENLNSEGAAASAEVSAEGTEAETKEEAPAAETAPAAEGSYTASAQGFGGPVAVTLTLDENQAISTIEIGDANFAETPGLGAKAQEDEFRNQFIGKKIPVSMEEIDAIAGATITTTAVVTAINEIAENLNSEDASAPAAEPSADTTEEAPAETAEDSQIETAAAEVKEEVPAVKVSSLGNGRYQTEAQGYGGPVAVSLTLNENKNITAIKIGDERFNETPGLGQKALEPAFQEQFIGKTIPLTAGDIDALTYATVTTEAVLTAINQISDYTDENGLTATAAEVTDQGGGKYQSAAQGYGGPVTVSLTLNENKEITAFEIGCEKFNETPGLGQKALEPAFQEQFIGKTIPLTVGDIDALTYATVTTDAVITAINQISVYVDTNGVKETTAEAKEEASADETASTKAYTASAQGFGGPVLVTLTLDENQAISSIEIGDANFAETPGLGAKALEEDFRKQFIGKKIPVSLEEIDAIASATITTTAVVTAINEIAENLNSDGAAAPVETPAEEAAADKTEETTADKTEEAPAAETATAEAYTASAQGFGGPVLVTLTLDENQAISSIEIGDANFAETPGLGAKAQEEDFRNQFIGKKIPVSLEEIDAIAGATITTTAVVTAINEIAENLNSDSAAPASEAPAEAKEEASADETAAAKTYTASAQGFGGPVLVTLTLDENQAISSIEIGDANFAETPGLGAKAQEEDFRKQFIGKKIPVSLEEIDAIASATITTTAVVTAINEIAENLK